jgi:tRNA-dihydrouridine synthase A
MNALNHTVCVAPMMDWTDRHERYFLRLISRRVLLYTEMVISTAVVRGDYKRLLAFDPAEHPVALQLGGADPQELATAAAIAETLGYDEINLNVGCPSDRVQAGRFGACLMAEPERVAACVAAMSAEVRVPVTVKTRIGIDDQDSYEDLANFVATVAAAGCGTFIVHARKAWLSGLSPKQNREVPPLCYEVVHRLKNDFPALEVILNGGLSSLRDAESNLGPLDGFMLGRVAYQNPYLLAAVDGRYFGDPTPLLSRREIVEKLLPYIERELSAGARLQSMTRHILGLYSGCPGARRWRRCLSERAHRPGAGIETVMAALDAVEPRLAA